MTKASLTDDLFQKLRGRIEAGEIAPGTRLPTQSMIAQAESVSRTVVREAVARLEAQGLAVSRQGSGVFVPDTARYRAFQVTRDELAHVEDVIKLLEMRLALESEMAGLAAERRGPSDVAAMRECLDRIAANLGDTDASAAADADFHLAIARASRNEYFQRLMDFLGVRLVPPRSTYLEQRDKVARVDYARIVRREHEAIFAAIEDGDATRARRAARRHMQQSLERHRALSASAAANVAA